MLIFTLLNKNTSHIERNSYKITFTLLSQQELGAISGELMIYTTSELAPKITVPIMGTSVTSFLIDPKMLFFVIRDKENSLRKNLVISNKDYFDLSLACDDPMFEFSSDSKFPSKECILQCRLKNEQPWNTKNGVLKLKVTGHPYEKMVEIPYSVVVY